MQDQFRYLGQDPKLTKAKILYIGSSASNNHLAGILVHPSAHLSVCPSTRPSPTRLLTHPSTDSYVRQPFYPQPFCLPALLSADQSNHNFVWLRNLQTVVNPKCAVAFQLHCWLSLIGQFREQEIEQKQSHQQSLDLPFDCTSHAHSHICTHVVTPSI